MSEEWVRHVEVAPGEFVEVGPYITTAGEAEALARSAAEQAEELSRRSTRHELRITLRLNTAEFRREVERAMEAATRLAARQLAGFNLGEPEPYTPDLDGLAAGLDDLLDGDDELAAELRTLAEGLDLSPSLGGMVWEALTEFEAALAKVVEAKRQVETEIRRRRGPRVHADDLRVQAESIQAIRINPVLGVPLFGQRVTAEDLAGLDAARTWLDEAARRSTAGEVAHALYTAANPDAPTLTRAELGAAEELRAAIRGKVEAAHTAGRRVNVLEVGNVEWCILGCLTHYPLELADGRAADLTIRRVDQERALSVLYDAEA